MIRILLCGLILTATANIGAADTTLASLVPFGFHSAPGDPADAPPATPAAHAAPQQSRPVPHGDQAMAPPVRCAGDKAARPGDCPRRAAPSKPVINR